MQVLDEAKRNRILEMAARAFSEKEYHEVCLSEIAAAASVGKGTLYGYFKSKDDLFREVFSKGYELLMAHMKAKIDLENLTPRENLRILIEERVSFAYRNPAIFKLLRMGATIASQNEKVARMKVEVESLTMAVIEKGIERGIFLNKFPALAARYVLDMVRSGLSAAGGEISSVELTEHLYSFANNALSKRSAE
jgi:AcrR family transcriptional regulator